MYVSQYHVTKLSENTDEEMEQNDNKDIDQALKELEGSLGTTTIANKVLTMLLSQKLSPSPWYLFMMIKDLLSNSKE